MKRESRLSRRVLLTGLAVSALALPAGAARAAEPIKLGDINSYSTMASFMTPYKHGWQLALEEINAKGGVLGRPLEIVWRDDAGKPGNAIKAASDLVNSDQVVALTGTFFSHVGLAVSDFAKRNKIVFLAPEALTDAMTWSKGNRYTFRLRPSTYMQVAMLADAAAQIPAKRWATLAPNYEFGQSAVSTFKELLSKRRSDIEWVTEQWPPLGKLDAGPTVVALQSARPEALFNATFGPDLARLIREGTTRGLFRDLPVVSLMTGQPEFLVPLGKDAPEGWIVTGYPWYAIDTPEHRKFLDAYKAKWKEDPRTGSVSGYTMVYAMAKAIETAKSTDSERIVDAMEGMSLMTPWGEITFREIDHQSTMGIYVGRTAKRPDGTGQMVDWRYADGADYLPPDDVVRKLRPSD